MAKITYGPLVSDASGKVGDTVFARNRGGSCAKALQHSTVPVPLTGARVYNSVNQSIPDQGGGPITFDSEGYDIGGLHSLTTNTDRLTITKAGIYIITAFFEFTANADGVRWGAIALNTTAYLAASLLQATDVGPNPINLSALCNLEIGDYLYIEVYQDSGVALDIEAFGDTSPGFACQWLSA